MQSGLQGLPPEMSEFVTFDLNGWLDHMVGTDGKARSLGFRSCLFKPRGRDAWLFGAQALAAARDSRTDEPLIDVMDALALAAGYGQCPPEERKTLPSALWPFVADAVRADAVRTARGPVHLSVVIPDGRCLGTPKVRQDTGKTALETLYDEFIEARPSALGRSRIEFIWRSVAALKAAMDQGKLGSKPGAVLVISVSRKISWTVLELCPWPRGSGTEEALHILRRPAMDDCKESESWTARRVKVVREALAAQGAEDLEAIHRWTRYIEILATGMSQERLRGEFHIDSEAIEHRSWPLSEGIWMVAPAASPIRWAKALLPRALEKRIEGFRNGNEGVPLAIVLETPVGVEMTRELEALLRESATGVPIYRTTGMETVQAAESLARALGPDHKVPAWLDRVPGIDLEVRRRQTSAAEKMFDKGWLAVVSGNEAVPAGRRYQTQPDESRRVKLVPGIEYVHLHLRRGGDQEGWDERYYYYSDRGVGHAIRPSDHERIVEPLATVRPLSGEARIEVVEHFPDGRSEALAASRTSMRWSEMREEPPDELKSIPYLYIFPSSLEGWKDLRPLLQQVIEHGAGQIPVGLKDVLYKCTQREWQTRQFPLGSDGRPPHPSDSTQHRDDRRLLERATEALHSELEFSISHQRKSGKPKAVNRLHLPLTWLFTGCPEKTVEILLDAIQKPKEQKGKALLMDNEYSAWSIYSGVGRSVKSEDMLITIFDDLVGIWEHEGGKRQDKFLLAAVTHPMARRVEVRRVLNKSRERFERVKRFLDQQLENLLKGIHDKRPKIQKSLELRYITMGYRGLCQIRYSNPDWFPVDGEDTREISEKLHRASEIGRDFERELIDLSAPYLIGEGVDPTMPDGF